MRETYRKKARIGKLKKKKHGIRRKSIVQVGIVAQRDDWLWWHVKHRLNRLDNWVYSPPMALFCSQLIKIPIKSTSDRTSYTWLLLLMNLLDWTECGWERDRLRRKLCCWPFKLKGENRKRSSAHHDYTKSVVTHLCAVYVFFLSRNTRRDCRIFHEWPRIEKN